MYSCATSGNLRSLGLDYLLDTRWPTGLHLYDWNMQQCHVGWPHAHRGGIFDPFLILVKNITKFHE